MNRRLPIHSTSRIHTSALEWDYPFDGGPLGLPGGPSLFSGKSFNSQPSTRPSGPRHSLLSKIAIARFGWPGRNAERATGRATMSAICRPSELVRLSAINAGEEALKSGLEEKSCEFAEKGNEIYAKT